MGFDEVQCGVGEFPEFCLSAGLEDPGAGQNNEGVIVEIAPPVRHLSLIIQAMRPSGFAAGHPGFCTEITQPFNRLSGFVQPASLGAAGEHKALSGLGANAPRHATQGVAGHVQGFVKTAIPAVPAALCPEGQMLLSSDLQKPGRVAHPLPR